MADTDRDRESGGWAGGQCRQRPRESEEGTMSGETGTDGKGPAPGGTGADKEGLASGGTGADEEGPAPGETG